MMETLLPIIILLTPIVIAVVLVVRLWIFLDLGIKYFKKELKK